MKKEMNPTIGLAIGAAVLIALCVALYLRFVREAPLDPKVLGESRAGIDRTQERLRKAGIGGPAAPPNTRPGGAPPPGPQ